MTKPAGWQLIFLALGLFACGGGAEEGSGSLNAAACTRLADFCSACDFAGNKDDCEAQAATGDDAACQEAYENKFLDFCYPTSAYCEELRVVCETCTDATQKLNCITATSSRSAYDDPELCTAFDIAAQGSCDQP